jgi:transcription-repair coupling factor (superfamily II helicase)
MPEATKLGRETPPAEMVSTHLLQRFSGDETFRALLATLKERREASPWLRGLTGSSRSLMAAALARETGRTILLITPDLSTAEDLKDDLLFLLGPRTAAVFPDPSLEPYRAQHPRVALRAARIEALAALADPAWRAALPACDRLQVLVVPAVSLVVPVPRPEQFRSRVIRLCAGDTVDLDLLLVRLVRLGYSGVPMVGEYGDFGRRGGILDVYSFGRENPVRVEFDGDEVASLREFDPFSQRSLQTLPEAVFLPLWEWLPGEEELAELAGHAAARGARDPAPHRGHGWGDGATAFGGEASEPEASEWEPSEAEAPEPSASGAAGPGLYASADTSIAEELVEERLGSLEADGTLEGIEWSLPLFGDWRGRLTDYVPPEGILVVDGPTFVRSRLAAWADDLRVAWEDLHSNPDVVVRSASPGPQRGGSLSLPPAEPGRIFWLEDDRSFGWSGACVLVGSGGSPMGSPLATEPGVGGTEKPPRGEGEPVGAEAADSGSFDFHAHPPEHFGRNLEATRAYLARLTEEAPEIHVLCDTENHRDRLFDLLSGAPAQFHVGNLGAGFVLPTRGLAVLTDHEIFTRLRRRTAGRRFSRGISLKELLALQPGDFVVHIDHGIGLYRGLQRLTVNGQETDCLALEYAGGDRHYVPVDQLALVQKYSADEGARPALSRLGGKSWERTKERVKKSIREMAGELIKTYAIRKARQGFAFSPDTTMVRELEAAFPYDETPDQLRTIEEVKADMEAESPMDRLVCGDVGYGKTEVAIRAALKVVQDAKQVAVLVPTTLLARQHYDTFRERLKDFPVVVDFLSRYRSPAEAKAVKQACRDGKVDIVIGTHALLSKEMGFRDLGLVVVDEEQLFGVAAKEKLKRFRTTVDVLTLTATPIPRTMHLALMGGRDLSVIMTPPRDRRPIQTEILEFRDDIIAHALMREADRGGQSFFVHNRVESIDAMASYLGRLVPHLRLAIAHGQMRDALLEDVMSKFLAGEFDVLISTMIIESGLDLPNVNTILINRGDTFGLAQLYQLRGRVGRSARKAYAYLLVPPYHAITELAQKRLKAMEEFEDLGSGYQLALRDLEIRGAGNLLGSEQHGFIINVGFELYCQLLDEAVRELRGEARDEYREPRMATDIQAFLPDDYVPDSREKMNLYKSLADARGLDKIEEIAAEMTDRFGKHPEPVRHLLGLRRVRILGAGLHCEKITVRAEMVRLDLGRDLSKAEVQRFLQGVPFQVEFLLGGQTRIRRRSPGPGEAISTALIMLRALAAAKG